MTTVENKDGLTVRGDTYELKYRAADQLFVDLQFSGGVGAKLFVASGCDRDDGIDEVIKLDPPAVDQDGERVTVTFADARRDDSFVNFPVDLPPRKRRGRPIPQPRRTSSYIYT